MLTNLQVDWPEDQQKYKLYGRGCVEFVPSDGGPFTCVIAKGKVLPDASFTDDFSDSQEMSTYKGEQLYWKRPGRGEGLYDVADLKLMSDIDPRDLSQGGVGNCWLIAAFSALSEFDGEVAALFDQTEALSAEGKYTIKLYDLPTQDWKEYVIDDRIACRENGRPLSLSKTADSEIWCVVTC